MPLMSFMGTFSAQCRQAQHLPRFYLAGRRDKFFAKKDREGIEYPDPPGFEHRYIQANGLR